MDIIQKVSILCTIVGWIGYKCMHNPVFLLLFAVSASVLFLRDKEESHIFLNLLMVGLIIAITIKVLFF